MAESTTRNRPYAVLRGYDSLGELVDLVAERAGLDLDEQASAALIQALNEHEGVFDTVTKDVVARHGEQARRRAARQVRVETDTVVYLAAIPLHNWSADQHTLRPGETVVE